MVISLKASFARLVVKTSLLVYGLSQFCSPKWVSVVWSFNLIVKLVSKYNFTVSKN